MLKHLAVIMDGNRRWAKKNNLYPWQGHEAGFETLQELVAFCIEQKIPYLSVYAFSLENFKRSTEEKTHLFSLLIKTACEKLGKFKEAGIRIRFVGDQTLFPESVRSSITTIEQETGALARGPIQLDLLILFCYGGQQELIAAAQKICSLSKAGLISESDITQENFRKYLWTGKDIPDPSLIIRTGGAGRLSNFLLYQSAYSELYFTNTLWPDMKKNELLEAVDDFHQRKRNFGA